MTNVLQYLEQSAEKFPNKIAFADQKEACTWQQLKQRAERIGSALAARKKPGAPVAVWMEKSVDAIAAFMGIVSAGCFYVMLDIKQPVQRIAQILAALEQPLAVRPGRAGPRLREQHRPAEKRHQEQQRERPAHPAGVGAAGSFLEYIAAAAMQRLRHRSLVWDLYLGFHRSAQRGGRQPSVGD